MVAIERQFKLHALVAVEKGDVQRIILFLDGQPLFITVIFAVRILFGYINRYSVSNLGDCHGFLFMCYLNGMDPTKKHCNLFYVFLHLETIWDVIIKCNLTNTGMQLAKLNKGFDVQILE